MNSNLKLIDEKSCLDVIHINEMNIRYVPKKL